MQATQCLRKEHQVILSVLDCFEIALRNAVELNRVGRAEFTPFLDFFRGFADRCHHCKEEDRLFPHLEQLGIPREGGPIGVMLIEHEQGRMHVRTMGEHLERADAGDEAARQAFLEHGRQYLELLRDHIGKEDHCLFSMADQVMQKQEDLISLQQAYDEAEAAEGYCDTLSNCRSIADQLLATYGVTERSLATTASPDY